MGLYIKSAWVCFLTVVLFAFIMLPSVNAEVTFNFPGELREESRRASSQLLAAMSGLVLALRSLEEGRIQEGRNALNNSARQLEGVARQYDRIYRRSRSDRTVRITRIPEDRRNMIMERLRPFNIQRLPRNERDLARLSFSEIDRFKNFTRNISPGGVPFDARTGRNMALGLARLLSIGISVSEMAYTIR